MILSIKFNKNIWTYYIEKTFKKPQAILNSLDSKYPKKSMKHSSSIGYNYNTNTNTNTNNPNVKEKCVENGPKTCIWEELFIYANRTFPLKISWIINY